MPTFCGGNCVSFRKLDGERDQQFGRGKFEFHVRCHEGAQAEAHRDAAEHEVEDVAASIGLREVRRQPIGPGVGFLQRPDRRADIMRFGAPRAIARPFVADLRLGVTGGSVARAKSPDTGRG